MSVHLSTDTNWWFLILRPQHCKTVFSLFLESHNTYSKPLSLSFYLFLWLTRMYLPSPHWENWKWGICFLNTVSLKLTTIKLISLLAKRYSYWSICFLEVSTQMFHRHLKLHLMFPIIPKPSLYCLIHAKSCQSSLTPFSPWLFTFTHQILPILNPKYFLSLSPFLLLFFPFQTLIISHQNCFNSVLTHPAYRSPFPKWCQSNFS